MAQSDVGAPAAAGLMKRPVVLVILAVLDLLFGGLWLLAAVGLGSTIAGEKLDVVQLVLFVAFGIIGLLAVVAGIGLLQMKEYGRIVQLALSTIGLLAIPVGTIISALVLYYLTRPGMKVLFSGRKAEELSNEERAAVIQLEASGGAGIVIGVVVGLLVIVAFTGIVAAIAIPNLITAMQRSKQKRTVADIRTIAVAWEARATDTNTYSLSAGIDGEHNDPLSNSDSVVLHTPARVSADELARVLTPTYARVIPRLDGWEREIELYVGASGGEYAIRSCGKDGMPDGEAYREGATKHFDCDIVYSAGVLVSYPEGIQTGNPAQ